MTATTAHIITAPPAPPIAAKPSSLCGWWIAPAFALGVLFWVWVFDAALQWIGGV